MNLIEIIKVRSIKFFPCLFLLIILNSSEICVAQNLLSGPQKIVIDIQHNRYLVSNWSGDIVQLDSLGNQSYFKKDAEFNDGMEIVGNTVYGSYFSFTPHQGKVKGYDLDTRQLVMEIAIDYVLCTSSITADSSGNLYISADLGTSIVKLRLSDQTHWVFTQNQGLTNPNGMIYEHDNNRLVVCEDRFNPSINAVSLLDSSVTTLATTTLAGSDGIARDVNGNYYLAGYFLDGIYKFNSDFSGTPEMIYKGNWLIFLTYDASDNSLLVPQWNRNEWIKFFLPVTSVDNSTSIVNEFHVYQNYPNPFNPQTRINFSVPEISLVSLKVFDVLGKEIATLVDEEKKAGTYEVGFDAVGLTSGIYFYKLVANNHYETKKMIILK